MFQMIAITTQSSNSLLDEDWLENKLISSSTTTGLNTEHNRKTLLKHFLRKKCQDIDSDKQIKNLFGK